MAKSKARRNPVFESMSSHGFVFYIEGDGPVEASLEHPGQALTVAVEVQTLEPSISLE